MVVPYKKENSPKKEQVKQMFDKIASRYDFLNHFLTVGIDKYWRKKVCKIVAEKSPKYILDMASGTGDLAIAISRLKPEKIIGIDISDKMLEIADKKVKKKGLDTMISFQTGDAEAIQEADNTFDMVTCAFGVRNFQDMHKGIAEFHRVLKAGGSAVILELSVPRNPLFRIGYHSYFHHILPLWGKLVAKDLSAYKYLPESVAQFPKNDVFLDYLKKAGFKQTYAKSLSLGIATIFVATK